MTPTHKDLPELQSPGPFDSQSLLNRVLSQKRFLKFAAVLVAFFVAAFTLAVFVGGFKPIQSWQQYWTTRQIMREAREREEFEKNDIYGGRTPEETYQLFLQALEKQDIELASKYFVREKQDWAREFFTEVQGRDQWQSMINDLSGKTTKIEYKKVTEEWYEIKLRKPTGTLAAWIRTEKYGKRELWKLIELL